MNGLGVGDVQTVNFVPPQRSGVHQQSEMQKNQKEREQRRGREFAARECRFFRYEPFHPKRPRAAARNPSNQIAADKIDNPPPKTSHAGR